MYKVELSKSAANFFRGQTKKIQRQLKNKLKRLEEDARPHGCEEIKGAENLYRLRSGDYRIVYQVFDDKILIIVVRIGHRSYVYKRLTT